MTINRRYLILVLVGLVYPGCDCSGDQPLSPPSPYSCEEEGVRPTDSDYTCLEGERFVKGVCDVVRCDASELENNCCPGQYCNNGGICEVAPARYTTCTQDSACPRGQVCLDRPEITIESKTCGLLSVDDAGACPEGGVPFNQRCVLEPPCGGSCGTGEVCNIGTNLCEPTPSLAGDAHGCAQTCGEDNVLVYTDPDNMLFEGCCALFCACEPLPKLPEGAWGSHSDVERLADSFIASAYSSTYGDLVVATMDITGAVQTLEFVDGVPADGSPSFDPSGPRGGKSEPGEDVGLYTSLAITSLGDIRVAYYDRDKGDLKFAAFDANSDGWTVSVVDRDGFNADPLLDRGDAGQFASLVLDSNDIPSVIYFVSSVDDAGSPIEGLMYARATKANPTEPADWQRIWVDSFAGCGGLCSETETCLLVGATPTCMSTLESDDCSCECDEACADAGAGAQCYAKQPHLVGTPCPDGCSSNEACVPDGLGGGVCKVVLDAEPSLCDPVCTDNQACVEDGQGSGTCQPILTRAAGETLPQSLGFYGDLILQDTFATVVYYDHFGQMLRGAKALFSESEDLAAGFLNGPVQCGSEDAQGLFATLALSPTDSKLGVAFQGGAGQSLLYRKIQEDDFFDTNAQDTSPLLVDDGVRESSQNVVGAYADLVFGASGTPYIAYADQTTNDLRLAYFSAGAWVHAAHLVDGGFGSFAKIVSVSEEGGGAVKSVSLYVANVQRQQNIYTEDSSRLILHQITGLSVEP